MFIRNVTRTDLDTALDAANAQFDHNITFKRLTPTNQHHTSYRLTLTVLNSRSPGSRISPTSGRRIAAACWHAHRAFLQALPPTARITTAFGRWQHGDTFLDRNIGSQLYPCQASEACNC